MAAYVLLAGRLSEEEQTKLRARAGVTDVVVLSTEVDPYRDPQYSTLVVCFSANEAEWLFNAKASGPGDRWGIGRV